MNTRKRFVFTWMAIVAILLNALMPTVSLAFEPGRNRASVGPGDWVEICSTAGSSWVQLGAEGQITAQSSQRPEGAPAAAHQGHCPYCLTHAASFGLPPAPAWVLPLLRPVADLLPRTQLQVHMRLVWLIPVARAPPLVT